MIYPQWSIESMFIQGIVVANATHGHWWRPPSSRYRSAWISFMLGFLLLSIILISARVHGYSLIIFRSPSPATRSTSWILACWIMDFVHLPFVIKTGHSRSIFFRDPSNRAIEAFDLKFVATFSLTWIFIFVIMRLRFDFLATFSLDLDPGHQSKKGIKNVGWSVSPAAA